MSGGLGPSGPLSGGLGPSGPLSGGLGPSGPLSGVVDLGAESLADAAGKYDRVERSPLEDRLFGSLAERVRARGCVSKDDLPDVVRWRALRTSGFVARNDPEEVSEISRLAFLEAEGDRVKLKVLTLLDGVSERAAATLLAMWDPQRYAPWDERAASLLREAARLGDGDLPGIWPDYLTALRDLAGEAGLGLRHTEKAVFVLASGGPRAARAGTGGAVTAARSVADRGDVLDDAGRALLAEIGAHAEGVRNFAGVKDKAGATLRRTTPEERRLLLRLHRRLSEQMFVKTSRDLGWLYYADDVGRGLVGELALRAPRGIHELRLVAYLPVDVSAGANRGFFEGASATQQKGHIPTDSVDEAALLESFEAARRWVLLR